MEINKQAVFAFIFVVIVYRTVSYVFERLFKPGRNQSERFNIISVYINKAISSDGETATSCDSSIQPTHFR